MNSQKGSAWAYGSVSVVAVLLGGGPTRLGVDLVVLPVAGEVTGRVVENGLERNAAGIDVRNVMMNSTPKIRAVLWSSAIPSPFEPVGCLSEFHTVDSGFDQSRAGLRPAGACPRFAAGRAAEIGGESPGV
jgi:hypothetical protein